MRDEDTQQWIYGGRCTGEFKFGRAGTGTEQIGIRFAVEYGERAGDRAVWYGTLESPQARELVQEVIEACTGKSFEDLGGWKRFFSQAKPMGKVLFLPALQVERVSLVFQQRSGDEQPRLTFINREGIAMKDAIDVEDRAELLKLFDRLDGATNEREHMRRAAGAR